ncbi:interleukin-17 receptor A-like [Myxocyprinus asiaticus]|uniref:interleukin-17 receptor A-like n=1 Tax=Myxocyprinus asiaticus TaxID=70543 RepID=UPI0022238821|nr:interleukin-17 receptor A-like [Myxocyprinus asiaticus]
MSFLYLRVAVFFTFIPVVLNLRVLDDGLSLNCTQNFFYFVVIKGYNLTAGLIFFLKDNCMYDGWLKPSDFTPSGPDNLTVCIDVRNNMKGDPEPVIVAEWKAKDDGSIHFLKGTEFSVMKSSTNEHLCVNYMFLQNFKTMRKTNGEKWSFSLDKVVVDLGSMYVVTVSNIPKPNLQHTSYNVNKSVVVPGICEDPLMQKTNICLESGNTWQPDITLEKSTGLDNKAILLVAFKPGENTQKHNVFVKCKMVNQMKTIYNEGKTLLNVTNDLENWPMTCCYFDVQIQPFFLRCANDCLQKYQSFNICTVSSSPHEKNSVCWIICVGICLLIFGIGFCGIYLNCRKPKKGQEMPAKAPLEQPVPSGPRSVLIIYSRDHPLYADIVLKLCAFLRAKCGTEVVLDILDTAWLGTIGQLPWIEQQKRRIEQSSDKILVLCSRGVQAKWGAICGNPPILLREDVRSPEGDILTLALQLITPDMQRPASYGKYLDAYIDDISSEGDVPSMFDIAVKYKLMKHFEELYFRILDMEKYQQGMVHCFKGIGKDEYFSCPSGKALRDAIETFQAYQIETPDWFESECVNSEEEVRGETSTLLDIPMLPIYELQQLCNDGLPILVNEVEIHQESQSVCAIIPQIRDKSEESSVMIIKPRVQPEHSSVLSFHPTVKPPPEIPIVGMITVGPESYPCLLAEPVPVQPLHPPIESRWNEMFPMGEPSDNCLKTSNEGQNQVSFAMPSENALQQLLALQRFLTPFEIPAPPSSMEDSFHLDQEMDMSQPVEMEENEMEGASETRPSRGSDQGYSSRYSIVREEPQVSTVPKKEELYLNSPISSGFCTQTMENGFRLC